jgi:hypothetical protein
VQAKTRCLRPADTSVEACVRCNERGAQCEFDAPARRHRVSRQGDLGSTPGVDPPGAKDSEILTIARPSNRTGNVQLSTFPQTYPDIAAPLRRSADNIWETDFGEIDPLGLESTLVENQGIDSLLSAFSGVPDTIAIGTPSLAPWTLQLSGPSLFKYRAFTRPSQGPLVSLAMQILRSYPFMILRKAALPPFISPLLFSWAETGVGPPQRVSLRFSTKSGPCADRPLTSRL